MRSKTTSRVRALIESLDAAGILQPDQREHAQKALRKLKRAMQRGQLKAVEDGISQLARAFLQRSDGRSKDEK